MRYGYYVPKGKATNDRGFMTEVTLVTPLTAGANKLSGAGDSSSMHRVVLFDRLAEIAYEYLRQESEIFVEGELHTEEWEKYGLKQCRSYVIADELQIIKTFDLADEDDSSCVFPF